MGLCGGLPRWIAMSSTKASQVNRRAARTRPSPRSEAESYRRPMSVTAVRRYPGCPEMSSYPLCPRCVLPMQREYQAFCDRCGQALSWVGFSRAVLIPADSPKPR